MAAITITFTPAVENLYFTGSRPSRQDAILLGMDYYNAPTVAAEDDLLNEYGAVLVRRSLRAFANYAKRNAQPDVAKAAEAMRDEIKVAHWTADEDVA